jgi:hypothetical protein
MITFVKKRKTNEAKKGSQREASKPKDLAKKEKTKSITFHKDKHQNDDIHQKNEAKTIDKLKIKKDNIHQKKRKHNEAKNG